MAVALVSVGEVYDGAVGSSDSVRRMAEARALLGGFVQLGLSDEIMEVFAIHRVLLRRAGQRLPDLDLLIAATALVHDLTLLTRNRRHYDRIPGLRLYQDTAS